MLIIIKTTSNTNIFPITFPTRKLSPTEDTRFKEAHLDQYTANWQRDSQFSKQYKTNYSAYLEKLKSNKLTENSQAIFSREAHTPEMTLCCPEFAFSHELQGFYKKKLQNDQWYINMSCHSDYYFATMFSFFLNDYSDFYLDLQKNPDLNNPNITPQENLLYINANAVLQKITSGLANNDNTIQQISFILPLDDPKSAAIDFLFHIVYSAIRMDLDSPEQKANTQKFCYNLLCKKLDMLSNSPFCIQLKAKMILFLLNILILCQETIKNKTGSRIPAFIAPHLASAIRNLAFFIEDPLFAIQSWFLNLMLSIKIYSTSLLKLAIPLSIVIASIIFSYFHMSLTI